MKTLDDEQRLATQEEQALLAQYTGWGASELSRVFTDTSSEGEWYSYQSPDGWDPIRKRASQLLTADETKAARRSTQYAHYTPEEIVRSIWEALRQFGFTGGTILEPGMGIGRFGSNH